MINNKDVSSIINLAIINKCIIPIVCEKSFDGFTITTPILPGCVAEGSNISEAVCDFINVMDALVESYRADGIPIPWKMSVTDNILSDEHILFINNQW